MNENFVVFCFNYLHKNSISEAVSYIYIYNISLNFNREIGNKPIVFDVVFYNVFVVYG